MKKILFLFFICGWLLPASAQLPLKFDLGGEWEFRQEGSAEWYPATVPGCVQLDLLKNRLMSDPFYRSNEDSVQWVAGRGWEYRRIFYADPSFFEARQIDLVLEGLDTYARVYLNDSLILSANNMFREWHYENTKDKLKSGKNELRIFFPSIVKEIKELYDKLPVKLPGDEKVVCRKAAYNFGWDWGPKLIISGIWKPVYLKFYNRVNLLGVQFIQKHLTDSAASLSGVFTLASSLPDTVSIRISADSLPLLTHNVSVKQGINIIRFDFVIKDPKLWWPNGMGTPYLYTLNYDIYYTDILAEKGSKRIGLRTIELVQQADTAGQTFGFLVNSFPVFMKGANYIPQDNFPTRVSDSAYRALLTGVKDLNMNMLRVWGGGIYEKDIFYDLCDELGILVWQDFMFACAMYPGDKDFMQNVNIESIQNIIRLRSHPCIALWCGNNEIDEGWRHWGWVKQYKYSPSDSARVYQGYKNIFNGILQNNVRKFDTLRPYIPSSPMLGWGNPDSKHRGDMHYWGVWWGKLPFGKYKDIIGRFMSEYGFQSFPDISSFKYFTQAGDLKLGSPVMKAHQKNLKGYEIIDEYMMRDYKRPKDFESYVYVSQLLQAEGMKTAIEAHRRAMPYCMGTLFWQYNDCWPVVSWSARDYYGAPKALHYFIRDSYKDVLVSPVTEKNRLRVYIVSERYVEMEGDLSIKLTDFSGKIIKEINKKIKVPAFQSAYYFDVNQAVFLQGQDQKKVMLTAVFTTSDERHVQYGNILYFVPVKSLSLENPVIKRELTEIAGGYKITLSSDKLAKNVWLSTTVSGKFLNNYAELKPGEPLDIIFITTSTEKDLLEKIIIRTLQDTY